MITPLVFPDGAPEFVTRPCSCGARPGHCDLCQGSGVIRERNSAAFRKFTGVSDEALVNAVLAAETAAEDAGHDQLAWMLSHKFDALTITSFTAQGMVTYEELLRWNDEWADEHRRAPRSTLPCWEQGATPEVMRAALTHFVTGQGVNPFA